MRKKRILAVLLSSAIAFSGMPGNVFAAEDVALEDGFSDGEEITEEVAEEPVEDVEESVPEIDQDAEDFAGFSDGESEEFVAEEELEDETDPETQVFADDEGVVESGKCGDDLTYTITGDDANGYTLTISGTGDMYDYTWDENAPWYDERKNVVKVVIEDGVTSIGNYSFYYYVKLKTIEIKSEINRIGDGAFYSCKNMNAVKLPESVTNIGYSAFDGCSSLEEIVIPDGIDSIDIYTFRNCSSLKSVKLPESITSIADYSFDGCTNLNYVKIPDGVTSIGTYAFSNCENLTSFTIPEAVTLIGWGAFMNCKSLMEITIPKKVATIGNYTFRNCSSLKSVKLPESVTNIGYSAFDGCSSLEEIVIPDGIDSIGEYAFSNCWKLTLVTIPEGIARIYKSTFYASRLEVIRFTGSEEEWNQFDFEASDINNATVYYNYDPNHTHSYEESIIKEATCVETGEKILVCKFCGESSKEEIPATGHTIVIDPALEATCVQPGKTEGSHCSICGEVILEQKSVPALGHMWDEGTITKEPTCTENGEKTYTCSRCNETKTEGIAKIEHTIVVDSAIESTCTLVGKTEGKHCAVCGKIIQAQMNVPKIAHTIVIDPAIPATCTIPGKTEGSHCSVCGEIITPQKTIAKSGDHNWAREVVKAATCTTNGEVLWTCTLCGTKKTMEIIASGHRWGEWEVIKESTAIEEGWQQRTCKICGMHDDEMIPKLSPAPTPTVDPINPSTVIITKGKTTILKPDSSWKNVKYSLSNKKVATVDKKGKVKAVAAGIAKITVKSGSESIVYTITVPGTTAIKGIKSSVSIKKGKRYTLKPKLSYTEKADKVTYKSSNKKIATVSKKGVIKGKKKGTATITIKSGKITKKCKVKVK